MWTQVASQMRRTIDFQKLDGSDDSNGFLKDKYRISGYPTLVFSDSSGAALKNDKGAPSSAEDFKQMISEFAPVN